jgi:hypothetical protein
MRVRNYGNWGHGGVENLNHREDALVLEMLPIAETAESTLTFPLFLTEVFCQGPSIGQRFPRETDKEIWEMKFAWVNCEHCSLTAPHHYYHQIHTEQGRKSRT